MCNIIRVQHHTFATSCVCNIIRVQHHFHTRQVTLPDRSTYTAKLVGHDVVKNLAVLKLSMPKARWGAVYCHGGTTAVGVYCLVGCTATGMYCVRHFNAVWLFSRVCERAGGGDRLFRL